MVQPPTLDEMRRAAHALAETLAPTPLVALKDGPANIRLKLETFQPVGSFKVRGVLNAVSSLTEPQRARGLSTVSAGNTAQALAWCARRFGVPARSVMPETAPAAKIDAVRALGAEPVLVPTDDLFRYMTGHGWESEPWSFIHPWTNRNVMIGHASMGLEILDQCPGAETVYIPVGGGGLLAGVGSALRALKPSIRIVAVEPAACPALHESIARGRPARVDCRTICDGVAVPYITDEMFPILRDLVDGTALVSDDDVRRCVRRLALAEKLVAEPSGALALAAPLATGDSATAVCILTGASIDAPTLADILGGPALRPQQSG